MGIRMTRTTKKTEKIMIKTTTKTTTEKITMAKTRTTAKTKKIMAKTVKTMTKMVRTTTRRIKMMEKIPLIHLVVVLISGASLVKNKPIENHFKSPNFQQSTRKSENVNTAHIYHFCNIVF